MGHCQRADFASLSKLVQHICHAWCFAKTTLRTRASFMNSLNGLMPCAHMHGHSVATCVHCTHQPFPTCRAKRHAACVLGPGPCDAGVLSAGPLASVAT
eukprot:1440969-Alexandrium_andersonii.AAC.1